MPGRVANDFHFHAARFQTEPERDVGLSLVSVAHGRRTDMNLRRRVRAVQRLESGCVSGENCSLPLLKWRKLGVRRVSRCGLSPAGAGPSQNQKHYCEGKLSCAIHSDSFSPIPLLVTIPLVDAVRSDSQKRLPGWPAASSDAAMCSPACRWHQAELGWSDVAASH